VIGQWLSELSGPDIAGLLVAAGAIIAALFGWLSAREARKLSTRPLESAERLMKATEQVNARTADAMDTLTTAVTTHLSDLKAHSVGSAAKIDEIIRQLSSARRTHTRRRT
jgi:hypothetical protein